MMRQGFLEAKAAAKNSSSSSTPGPTAPPAGAPGTKLMAVTCPRGSSPGDSVTITVAGGKKYTVKVPPGIRPGAKFNVRL